MSAAEALAAGRPPAPAGPAAAAGSPAARGRLSTRFFRSELWLIFGRRRNWAGLAVLAAVPVVVAVAVRLATPEPGDGPDFLSNIAGNGLFVALVALVLELPLFLPLAVGAIAGDSVAGEANLGTLRYLLPVPVHRTRLLAVKFGAIAVFALAATLLVAVVGAGVGLALFGGGPFATLSGTLLPFWAGVGRVLLVTGYLAACLVGLGAIGLFVSTLTEQPIGATIAVVMVAITSQILNEIPQLSAVHQFLPTHYWLAFGDLLRDPVATGSVWGGLASAAVYTAVFLSAAWARFAARDVSS
ncbi:MAG TPA: ABC transporter permease [Micromonosporaceae bacterium]|nr:ABC transporter permease [Micromonosporaceae bacterium]